VAGEAVASFQAIPFKVLSEMFVRLALMVVAAEALPANRPLPPKQRWPAVSGMLLTSLLLRTSLTDCLKG
jgi:hypothetical protein